MKRETERCDALAEDSGASRAAVVRQLAAEGLVTRRVADRAAGQG